MTSDSHAILTSEQAALLAALLQPLERADRAIGREPGPFRFETNSGYRDLSREDLSNAAQVYRTLQSAAIASTAGAGAGDWADLNEAMKPVLEERHRWGDPRFNYADTREVWLKLGAVRRLCAAYEALGAAPAVPASPRSGASAVSVPPPGSEERDFWLEAAIQHGFEETTGGEHLPEYDPPAYFATADEVLALMASARQQGREDVSALSQGGGAGRSEKGEGEDEGRRAIRFAMGLEDHWDRFEFLNAFMGSDLSEWPEFTKPEPAPAQSPSTSDAEG